MPKISELLAHGAVQMNMHPESKKQWIEQLVDLLVRTYSLESQKDDICDAVLAREDTLSTAIGNGLAIPHAKTDVVPKLLLACGIAPDGVEFGAPDGRDVQVAFILASPASEVSTHVRALASISRIMYKGDMTAKLVAATSTDEVASLLHAAENKIT